jgi:glycosyltransferase involved in cell wall biosynthesis
VRLICRLRGIPVLDWYIGVKRPESGLKWTLRRFYYKWSAAQLLYGEHARNFYIHHGFRSDRIFVVRNSLDHDRQVKIRAAITQDQVQQTRLQLGVTDASDRLTFCAGRLEARKRLDVLLRALSLLRTRGKRVLLMLIGDGPETANLRRLAETQGVAGQVSFYGPCYDEPTLGRIMSASDLCVSPGATGLTVIHSLVYGTPILTQENTPWLCRRVRGNSGVGALVALDFGESVWLHGPEVEAVFEGRTGGFVRGDKAEDWAAKMESMLYPVAAKTRMADACMKEIDEHWTPRYQERVVIQALNHVLPPRKRIPLPP